MAIRNLIQLLMAAIFLAACEVKLDHVDGPDLTHLEDIPVEAEKVAHQVLENLLDGDIAGLLKLTDTAFIESQSIVGFEAGLPLVVKLAPDKAPGDGKLFWKEIRYSEDSDNKFPIFLLKYRFEVGSKKQDVWIAVHDRDGCCKLRHVEIRTWLSSK